MAQGIEIGIGTSYDAAGVNETNQSIAKLVSDIGRANEGLRNATMRASRDMNRFAEKADSAARAMGGGYKDAEEFVREAARANESAVQSVKRAESAFDDFRTILKRSAEAVDQRNRNLKQAEEVMKVLKAEQERLSQITDKSSDSYKKSSRNVEILTQSLKMLGVQVKQNKNDVESQPRTWTSAFSRIGSGVGGILKGIAGNLANIHHGFMMAASAVRTFMSAMSRGMEFETMTARFKSLTGSMELARAHMSDLQDLGRTPPFSLKEFAAASQQMMKMTGGMAGFRKEMEMVGDMAAATGNSIEAVGRAFGLAYQVVRDGQSFGRAGQMLYTMGVMTKQQVAYFDELSKSGAKNTEVWDELVKVFDRYKGAMAETEKTTKGVVDAIKGEAEVALTDFSKAITEAAAPALNGLLGWLKRINEDGTIEMWAAKAAKAAGTVANAFSAAANVISKVKGMFDDPTEKLNEILPDKNDDGWEEWGDWEQVNEYTRKRKRVNSLTGGEQYEREEDVAKKKAYEKRIAEQKAEAEAEKRMAEDMARGQIEIDKRVAAEKAKKDAEEAEKAEKERLKAVEAERKAREKMEADLHRQRVENARKELKAATDKQSAMQSAASAAQTEFDKAFGMYRDRDLAARTIAEERDYAADYKRLKKDANRYGGSWRISELASLMTAGDVQGQAAKLEEWRKSSRFTPEVEAMVRASAADQTRTTAEAELRKIAANTEGLAQKLDQLLEVK